MDQKPAIEGAQSGQSWTGPKFAGLFSEIRSVPSILQAAHLLSLDGLRGFSILLVVIFHVVISYKLAFPAQSFAVLGVQFFFVISGFLITTLLIKEKIANGRISLRHFYLRRVLRIVPVAYLYLFLVVLLDVIFKLHLSVFYLVASFLFIRNFIGGAKGMDHLTSHYWSLSVEEQFYVLFPVILKMNFRVYIGFLWVILGGSALIAGLGSFLNLHLAAESGLGILVVAVTQFQAIAIGSLTSVLLFKTNFSFPARHRLAVNAGLLLTIGVLAFFNASFSYLVGLMICLCIALFLTANLTASNDFFFRLLNHPAMKFIGVISYSMYIWQQPLTQGMSTLNQSGIMSRFHNKLPVDLVVTAACLAILGVVSYLSYFYFERTFLKLRAKYR